MNRNYQKELEKLLLKIENEKTVPSLWLHSCCAPCSSYCLEYLSKYFQIIIYYYNPNIYPEAEFYKRAEEQERFIRQQKTKNAVKFILGEYNPEKFFEMARGLEQMPEGGERCSRCYELRMRDAAERAKKAGADYFTTTLSISPLKNAGKINEIGEKIAAEYGIAFLNSDFKKKGGYQRSIELSREFGLYRQDYCGCVYSRQERDKRKSSLES